MDNLFTTVKLLERLRAARVGGAGTVRTSKTPREVTMDKVAKASGNPS